MPHSGRHSKLRGKQMHAAPLSFSAEDGSLSGNCVHNQPYLFQLLSLSFPLSVWFPLSHVVELQYVKPTYIMQLRCKHTGSFIRHFLHLIPGFGIGDFPPSVLSLLGTLALQKMAFHSFPLLPFILLRRLSALIFLLQCL